MSFFKSELIEGYRRNYCPMCRRGNCKHINRWKIESTGVWIENLNRLLRITKPKKYFHNCGDRIKWKFHSPDRFDDAREKAKTDMLTSMRNTDKVGEGVYSWVDNKIH